MLIKKEMLSPFRDTRVVGSMDLKGMLYIRSSQVPSTTLSVRGVSEVPYG